MFRKIYSFDGLTNVMLHVCDVVLKAVMMVFVLGY